MRLLCRTLALFAAVLSFSSVASAQLATLNFEAPDKHYIIVDLDRVADPNEPVVAALYRIDKDKNRIQISYVIVVFEFPTSAGVLNYDLAVDRKLTASLGQGTQCPNALQLNLESNTYNRADWERVLNWLSQYRRNPSELGTITISKDNEPGTYSIESFDDKGARPQGLVLTNRLIICLKPEGKLPAKSFDAQVAFNGNNRPRELMKPVSALGLDGMSAPPFPTLADDNGLPGDRGLERNLDLGVAFTRDTDKETGKKINRGILDLRLAPLLDYEILSATRRWYPFFTPFYIDASVATGKIEKETLAINRVVEGTSLELRYYPFKIDPQTGETITRRYQTFHRLTFSGENRTDRDFKQAEFDITFEYSPVLASLNHPIHLNWRTEKNRINPDVISRLPGRWGYQIIPRFGVEIGRTYARRDPAEAIKVSPTAKRFFTGLDIKINLTARVAFSIKDTFWLRGEAPDDRFHNHFKGEFEAPLSEPFYATVHSFFMSFERGNKPPFATPDTNVLKLGYRIRSEGWFDKFR